MPENETVNTGSIVKELGLPSLSDSSLKGQERVISALAHQVDTLTKDVHAIKTNQILKETQLPPEVLEQLGLPQQPPPRLKRGRGYRPLLSHEILEAKRVLSEKKTEFNEAMVARYLGVSYFTYKKYAKMYGIWDPKPNVKGKRNIFDPERGKYPLSEILKGAYPDYPVFRIKDKLIRSGVKKPQCELCGFKEKRMVDGKIPLLLNFMDSNPKNHSIENMKLYCLNCTFTSGRGFIRSGQHFFDPDWLQGGEKDVAEEPVRW